MLKRIDTLNVPDGHTVRVPMTMMDEKDTAYEQLCDRLENAYKSPPKPVTGSGSGTLPPIGGGGAKDQAYEQRNARLEDAWRR